MRIDRGIAYGGMRQWYQQQHGGGLKIAGERYVALRKSVPSDRREALSGDVSTIRELLYCRLHVLPSGDYRLRAHTSGDCEVVSTSSTFAVYRRPI